MSVAKLLKIIKLESSLNGSGQNNMNFSTLNNEIHAQINGVMLSGKSYEEVIVKAVLLGLVELTKVEL